MKYVNSKQQALSNAYFASKKSKVKGFYLSRILKSGKPGKPSLYETYGREKSAQDVIDRLERLNPGDHWVIAEF